MKNKVLLFIIFIGISRIGNAQNKVDDLFASFSEKWFGFPAELVYLQSSKGIYETGEDLWFKAYQLDAQTMGLSDKSKTLYLLMVSSKDSVVWQEKYPIENGVASGHVYIDEKLPEGDYLLEGYTKCSFYKNDTIGIILPRKIKIVNNISRSEVECNPKDSAFRFEMYPEGGNLVSGILSKLAFKATDGKSNPALVEGTLFQDGEPLSTIKSTHDGMGAILFTPHQGKNYRIELKNGKSYPLPDINSEGLVLRLSKQDKKQLNFVVSKSSGLPNQQIYLMGQMRGMVCCIAEGELKDNLKITIPLSNFLYQGIVEFTLFDEAMQPVAERLVYVHPEKKLTITAELEKKSYTIREKAMMKIKVTDENGNPARTNLGVSIYDQAYNNPADPVNLLVCCYLTSQIRGKICNPAFYFDETNKGRTEAMELLLLTQGWRRYVWNTTGSAYTGQLFLSDEINGTQTIKSKKGQQGQDTEQLIQISGAKGNSLFIWADSTGNFTVDTKMMNELRGEYVYLKPMLSGEFKPALKLVDYFSEIDSVKRNRQRYYPIIDLSDYRKEIILNLPVVSNDSIILLNEVTVTGKGRKPFRDKFIGKLDSLAQINLGPWVCKHGWLENYKEGYTHHHNPSYCPNVVDDGEPRTAPVIGKQYTIMKAEYFPCNAKGEWCFKPLDRRIVTYQGANYSEEELLRMNNLWRTKGYYPSREFYQPDEMDIQSSIPDARNTLLWAPSIVTDEKGEATVSFYCSDINTGFTGVVEGVDGKGLLGTAKCEFRVMRK